MKTPGDQVDRCAWCLTQILVIPDLFSCETGMSNIGTEMQLKNLHASFLILPAET